MKTEKFVLAVVDMSSILSLPHSFAIVVVATVVVSGSFGTDK